MARVYAHQDLSLLAEYGGVPVINGLSDLLHPCQAITDYFTIFEKVGTTDISLAYIGDGNNMAHSLLLTAATLGSNIRVATPPGYACDAGIVEQAKKIAAKSGATIVLTENPEEAATDADVLYADVWTSMGRKKSSRNALLISKGIKLMPN